jgi:hypothetical protein
MSKDKTEMSKDKTIRYYLFKLFDCCNKCTCYCFTRRRVKSDKNTNHEKVDSKKIK